MKSRSGPKAGLLCDPAKLLLVEVSNEFAIGNLRDALNVAAEKAKQQPGCLNSIRRMQEAASGFEQHKKRMITDDIVGASVLYPVGPGAILRSCRTMVDQLDVWKSPRLPVEHVCFQFV